MNIETIFTAHLGGVPVVSDGYQLIDFGGREDTGFA